MSQKKNTGPRALHVAKQPKLTKAQRIALQRKRKRQKIVRLSGVLCATIGVLWLSITLFRFFRSPSLASQVVKIGTLDTSTLFDGVVFRSEKVITSEDEGYVKYIAEEGEKVQKGGTIFILIDKEQLSLTEKEKEEFEKQVYVEAENRKETSTNQDERYHLDKEIKDKIETYYNNRYEPSTSYIYALRSKLDSSVTNRTDLYLSEQQLTEFKKSLEANMEQYQIKKTTAESGIISYLMDGVETKDALETIKELTYHTYNEYRKANPTISLGPNPIHVNEPIYKLISNNEWYVVTYISGNHENWVEGKKYNLHFEEVNNEKVTFTLLSKKTEGKRTQLVFKSTNQLNHFLGARAVQFSIGNKSTSGLKIPKSAVVELNLIKIPREYIFSQEDQYYVLRQVDKKTETIPLDIKKSDESFVYVIQDLTNDKCIQLKDVLVKKGENKTYTVSESIVVSGVYVINSQVAKFKGIEIMAENKEYVLVKTSTKSSLKEMDKIIVNPKRIKNDQLLEGMKIKD